MNHNKLDQIDMKMESLRMGGAAGLGAIYGYTLSDIVALLTIVYFVLQIFILSPKCISIARNYYSKIKGAFKDEDTA